MTTRAARLRGRKQRESKRRMKTLISRPKPVLDCAKLFWALEAVSSQGCASTHSNRASTLSGQNKMAEISDCGSVIYHYANRGSGRNWLVSRAAIS